MNSYRVVTHHKDGREVIRTVRALTAGDASAQVEAEIRSAREEKILRVEPIEPPLVTPKQVEFMREMTTRPAP